MKTNAKTCPPTDTLNDFVQGKLEPPTLDECELHIAECPDCIETLRGLGSEDTLTGHVAAAMNEPDPKQSSAQLDNLMERLLTRPVDEFHQRKAPNPNLGSHVSAELMADRAAEVLRCLEPAANQSLGAIGDYDLERLIGTGSSGVVFQATDRTLHRTVALKVLRPSLGEMARQRFIAEARSAAAIEHPNVVTIYQVGQEDRLAFMAMQWIPGQSLEQLLAAGTIFDEAEIRQIARQIAAGLQAAHNRQIIHRDIKPANIWITEQDSSVKILDFGLARISDDDPGLTATGMLAGTPNFMSPEQAKGLELDGRSDLFSLGCLMYRLLTGRLPFGASTVLATLQAIQNHQPPSVQSLQPNCSDDLTDITMALLEKQPANRPESASQLVSILDTDRSNWPVQLNRYQVDLETDDPVSKPQPSGSRSSGNFSRWIIATIALGLLGLGGFFFAPQIIRIATDQGEIVIETNDPDVEVEFLKDGKTFRVVDTKTNQSFDIRSGSYEIRAKANSANSQGDQNVAFDVTPKRLIMKRGQQQIVTVTKTKNTSGRTLPDDLLSGLLGGGSPNSDPKIQAKELVPEKPYLKAYPITTDPKLAFDLLATMLEGSGARMQQDVDSKRIIVLGRKEDHDVVLEALAAIEKVERPSVALDEQSGVMTVLGSKKDVERVKETLKAGGNVDEVKAQISDAESALSLALGDMENTRGLVKRGYRKWEELEEAQQVVESAKLRLDNASQKLWLLKRFNPSTGGNSPLYEGQNFDHWMKVAKNDRSARAIADAIEACGALAETDAERGKLSEIIGSAAQRYGTWVEGFGMGTVPSDDQYVMRAILKAIWNQPPELAVNFVEAQLKNGNSRSIRFCGSIFNGPDHNFVPTNNATFRRAFAGRLNVLLPLALEKQDQEALVHQLVNSAGFVSRKELLKLNPNLDSLVTKLFWEQTKLEDSQLVGAIGRLAAHLRVDDEKIVEKLANQYMSRIWVTNAIYDDCFRALTTEMEENWYPNNYRPLVGWHDELRVGILLKILQAELSDEAVRRRGGGKPNANFDGPAMMVYRVQECLNVLLPKMSPKVRRQAKEKLAETKRDLPEALKSSLSDANVEHNLKALIASCDGKAEPAFIKAPNSKWGNTTFGGGGFGFGGSSGFGGGKVTEQGQQKTESTVEITQVPVDSVPDVDSPRTDGSALVYDGQNFRQWLETAKTDRSPKTVANAIRACGALAETETEVKELFEVMNRAAQRHGNAVVDGGIDDEVMSVMLTAIWNQPPERAVDFVAEQLKNGNSRSLQFCTWILVGGFDESTAPDISKLNQSFASRLDELLPLATKRDKLVDNLVPAAFSVSRESLLKLNPELQSLVVKLFWEQAKLADSQSVASLGTLAAYLRIDDAKIVEHLANHCVKHVKKSNGLHDLYFQALTSVATQRNQWGTPKSFQPIVGWHDKIRFPALLELLVAELSDDAVRRIGFDKRTFRQNPASSQFLMVYELQECLHAILPKMDSEVRQKARHTFLAVKRNLPATFKSSDSQKLDIENNLDALIAACDGKSEPEFIKVGQAEGSPNYLPFGGGNGGGGVF